MWLHTLRTIQPPDLGRAIVVALSMRQRGETLWIVTSKGSDCLAIARAIGGTGDQLPLVGHAIHLEDVASPFPSDNFHVNIEEGIIPERGIVPWTTQKLQPESKPRQSSPKTSSSKRRRA